MRKVHILIIILVGIELFSFSLISDSTWDLLEGIIFGTIIFNLFIYKLYTNRSKRGFKYRKLCITLALLPILSCLPAYIFHDQPFYFSLLAARFVVYWFIYELLIYYKISSKKIVYLLLGIGIIWAVIFIVQQFTFPQRIFYTSEEFSQRAGFYRMKVLDVRYGVFAAFYLWMKNLEKFDLPKFLVFLLLSAALIFTATRQVIFPFFFVLAISFLFVNRSRILKKYLLVGGGLCLIMILFAGDILWNFIEITSKQDIFSDEYIRIQSAYFYGYENYPSWLAYFIGNGISHSYSQFGQQIQDYKDLFHFFHSDIGLIGAMNKYGIIYLVISFYFYVKVIKNVNNNHPLDLSIRMMFIYLFITAFTGQNYLDYRPTIILITLLLYAADYKWKRS